MSVRKMPPGSLKEYAQRNLRLIDSDMPIIIAELEKLFYMGKGRKIPDLCVQLAKEDPLNAKDIPNFYEKKITDFLVAVALGMTPKKLWSGKEEANGGYIVVNSDGSIFCYHLYDRDTFRHYLFNHTALDTPDSKKYLVDGEVADGLIYLEDSSYKMNLSLQIRFRDEDKTKKTNKENL